MLLAVEFYWQKFNKRRMLPIVCMITTVLMQRRKPRKLHQNEAVDAIDFSLGDALIDYEASKNSPFPWLKVIIFQRI